MPGYMIELDLSGRLALVVGLGPVGQRKAIGLRQAGARVIGVDPGLNPEGLPEGVEWRAEPYAPEQLAEVSLAFAAATPEVNRRVVADAKAAGIWVNSASDPTAGDFLVPATRRAGDLTVAVSTAGASPALAAALCERALASLGPSAAGLVDLLAELRPLVQQRVTDPARRRALFAAWSDPHWLDLYATAGPAAVREAILRTLEGQ